MMKAAVIFVVFLACVMALPPKWRQLTADYSFEQYKKDFGKHYEGHEEAFRHAIFAKNLNKVLDHNLNNLQSTYKMGVNHMTDWTEEEFKELLGYDVGLGQYQVAERQRKYEAGELNFDKYDTRVLPQSVDWRGKGVLTSVKDQGHCGSCWTFSSAETLEAHWALRTGTLEVCSEQHILSCTPNPQECGGTGGCQGGTVELAYSNLMDTGIASEWKYSYFSYSGNDYECHWSQEKVGAVVQLSGYVALPPNNQAALMKAVAFAGPVAVTVDASNWSHYETGIFDGCNQVNPDLDHGVQLVGYGTDNGNDYWTIRNSWSPTYGENGFIRIARQPSSIQTCGIQTNPQDGTGCLGGPANVTVCGTCGILYDSVFPVVDPYKS